jgi:RNA-directed DNA polymerase
MDDTERRPPEVMSYPVPAEKAARARQTAGEKVTEYTMVKVENMLKRVYDPRRLQAAWEQVRRNAGAAGIDKMTVEQFAAEEQRLLNLTHEKLKAGTYHFKPAKRVLIPKPGSTKMRNLGVPVVMDRVVSQSLNLALDEVFDPDFTESNFGFRRGKSQQAAINHVRQAVVDGHEWCASIDLKSFFDEIPHGLILRLLRRKISDEGLITLIARALTAGVMVEGKFERTTKGCPQGSPCSPILSNIVLNELDQELARRGHRYCRWADDFIILTKTERAAKRVKDGISRLLEEKLGLPINHEKSVVAPVKAVEFLGCSILRGKIRVSTKGQRRFKDKVRELTRRNNPLSMHQIILRLNEFLQGWVAYYRMQEFKKLFQELDWFIRSRLRSMQLKKWKKPRKFQRMMVRAGYTVAEAKKTWVKMRHWQSTERKEVRFVLNNAWFRRLGLVFLDDFTQRMPGLKLGR